MSLLVEEVDEHSLYGFHDNEEELGLGVHLTDPGRDLWIVEVGGGGFQDHLLVGSLRQLVPVPVQTLLVPGTTSRR